jgi:probable rRNA maturation factor
LVRIDSKVREVSARALQEFAARAQRAIRIRGEVDILITSSARLRYLNRRFRRKDTATDVLSFPATGDKSHVGDIAISGDMAAANARRLGHSSADELKILTLHGLLHLVDYDHEVDSGEMARKEARLRRTLGLPEALIERTKARRDNRAGNKKRRRS